MANTEQELIEQFKQQCQEAKIILGGWALNERDEFMVYETQKAFNIWKLGRAKAAQPEAVALPAYYARADQLAQVDRIGPGFCSLSAKPRAGLTEPLYTAPPASARGLDREKLITRLCELMCPDDAASIADEIERGEFDKE